MNLTHKHSTNAKLPNITRAWACVGSGTIGISKHGKMPFWSTGFQGCVGVVMCGKGGWGALAHLNQTIQNSSKSLTGALTIVSQFVGKQMHDKVTDVLLYFGDPGANLGEHQGANLTVSEVKRVMGCTTVIDLRRPTKGTYAYGCDFVHDPGLGFVYTCPQFAAYTTGLAELEAKEQKPAKTPFPFADYANIAPKASLDPALRDYFIVD